MPVITAREAAVLERLRRGCRHGDVMAASEFSHLRDPGGVAGGNITPDKARRALQRLEALGMAQSFDARPRTWAPASRDSQPREEG